MFIFSPKFAFIRTNIKLISNTLIFGLLPMEKITRSTLEVLTAMNMWMFVFWLVTSCGLQP